MQGSSDSVDEAKEQAAKKMIEILTKYQAGGEKDFFLSMVILG